ncbi:uncharacterized protein SPPG_00332 [Spizellomyces punctatus DAOM BR117]|uniref:SMP-LTD domain-containing protein n=1 Tax=Spizellomyces punctatus (strain DAOM BR117) TaxID=645134 RepID=A0A0L0HUS8_SPIPD|nr:uncharacterized protein SPPG_00332 [Spizellomyces punctatus DAOM BR117]KND04614.1 hypothetical protein SPPG_00332 [Spizellomyces punctatus DAOM BR117]|eukprot:XP_016612653.1 hypothetical protein SPPG_00332 [Spizellomyces punctatus DAOM BR117]
MTLQGFFSEEAVQHATSTGTSSFIKGLFFGILSVLAIEAFLVFRLVSHFLDPSRRLFKVSAGDRPSFAKEFIGVTGGPEGTGTAADHEILKDELLESKHKTTSSSAHHQTREHHEPWPENVVEFLRQALTPGDNDALLRPSRSKKPGSTPLDQDNEPIAMAETEQCHWINVLAHRFFLALRGSELFKKKAKAKWTEKINVKLKGKLVVVRIRCPSIKWPDMIGVAFVEDPGVSFRVDSPLTVGDNELLRGMVNKLLSSVVRKVFLELWVLPSWRTFFMPLMEPKLEDILARSRAAKEAASAGRKADSQSKASTLWETRSPLLRNSKSDLPFLFGDVLGQTTFQTSKILHPSTREVKELEDTLVTGFLKLAKDTDSDDIPPPSSVSNAKNQVTGSGGPVDSVIASESENDFQEARSVPAEKPTSIPSVVSTAWKTIRNRNGVHVQKKRILVNEEVAEITRAAMVIHCDADRVFAVLSNPEHNRQIDEGYVGSEIVHQFDEARCVRRTSYQFGKQGARDYIVFEVKRTRNQDIHSPLEGAPADTDSETATSSSNESAPIPEQLGRHSFVVVFRSIKAFSLDEAEGGDTKTLTGSPEKGRDETRDPQSDATAGSPQRGDGKGQQKLHSRSNSSSLDDVDQSPVRNWKAKSKLSVPAPASSKSENNNTVYLFGYLITPDTQYPSDTCHVTVLSQLSPDLARLEVSFDFCKKLKTFIEEFASLTGLAASRDRNTSATLHRSPSDASSIRRRRFFSDSSASSLDSQGQGRRMEKLKNIVGSTATYLMKTRKVSGWLGRQQSGELTGIPSDELLSATARAPSVELADFGGEASTGNWMDDDDSENPSEGRVKGHTKEESKDSAASMPYSENSLHDDGISFSLTAATSDLAEVASSDSESVSTARVTPSRSSLLPPPPPLIPKPPGPPILDTPYVERHVQSKELVRIEIPFINSLYPPDVSTYFAYDYGPTFDQSQTISFTLLFTPDPDIDTLSSPSVASILPHLPANSSESTTKTLFPATTVHLTSATWGVIPLSNFPSGTFILLFQNIQKVSKHLKYRADTILEGDVGICADVTVARKNAGRYPVVVSGNSGQGRELCWEFTTGGFDILFGVLYEEFEANDPKGDDSEVEHGANDLTPTPPPPIPPRPKLPSTEEEIPARPPSSESHESDSSTKDQSATSLSDVADAAAVISVAASGGDPTNVGGVLEELAGSGTREVLVESISNKLTESTSESVDAVSEDVAPPRTLQNGQSLSRPSISSRLAAVVGSKGAHSPPPSRPTSVPQGYARQARATYVVTPTKQKGVIRGKLNVTDRPGVYTFVWDNGYSLVVSKRVGFRVWVRDDPDAE